MKPTQEIKQESADIMSGKYGLVNYSSRKHISITVPSSTEVMSPHIKSVEELRVLGINLSNFNPPTQFFICVAGIFFFYLVYGYLQELIFSVEGFKPFGWYLTLVQFGFYSLFGLVELQLTQDKRRRIPCKTYMIIAFLTVGTMGLSNTSLGYLNYPTQVIFKCCKLIPVMIGGVFIQGKRYNLADVSAALCMSLGLIWFTLADSKVAPNFNVTGFIFLFHWFCVYSTGSAVCWGPWACSFLLLSASSDHLWLRILLFSDGIFWHLICTSPNKAVWSTCCRHSDYGKESHDHCTVISVLFKTFHFSVCMGWSTCGFWHLLKCLQ
ncbi:adenosine 3'-phospho 5'-phosphosulfate transporter 2 isoform X4 [Triplophysa dalaica]|uniref:adenosine 3'-phospho 5'-phosphosulfate transporter 2 isoform X4 n=1 Tax=Triplophysa dalaica TaxID=1582913 RepID=UPI0024DFD1BC|nr:adenosine 3'-phospho 5'-phosphosulfate transporter 2 isoform X4 [Triplophysa dalaica]